MWHEARRHEKKIRGMMVDYQKRSERRRMYYQRIKADPAQFLRLTGKRCKIYVEEEAIAIQNASSSLMPWQGQKDNLIDRFDVRAHLDVIPEPDSRTTFTDPLATDENAVINQKCHYERWRTLATNDLVGLSEADCLEQIKEDEVFVPKSEKQNKPKAQISYNYDKTESESESDAEDNLLSTEPDLDITFDVRELEQENKDRLNTIAANKYNIPDFTRLHVDDKVESELREYELRAEQSRIERVSKLSKFERRKEKEERRRNKEIPAYMKVDDPHRSNAVTSPSSSSRNHRRSSRDRRRSRRRGSSHRSTTSDDEDDDDDEEDDVDGGKVVQNIEITSVRSRTYQNVKKEPEKTLVPKSLLFLQQQKSTAPSELVNLAAKRRALLTNVDEDQITFGDNVPDEPMKQEVVTEAENSKTKCLSRSRSRSSSRPRRRYGTARSRSESRSRSKSRSRSRTRSRDRSISRSRSRERFRRKSGSRSRSRERTNHSKCKKISGPVQLKNLKPHERLKMKLQSQLKKQVRNEKKKEMMAEEQKEQEMIEREEELRVLKRKMWEKEEEEYWRKREQRRRKNDEEEDEPEDTSPTTHSHRRRSRSRDRSPRDHSYERSREKSHEKSRDRQPNKLPDYARYENSYDNLDERYTSRTRDRREYDTDGYHSASSRRDFRRSYGDYDRRRSPPPRNRYEDYGGSRYAERSSYGGYRERDRDYQYR